jgi:hypothetical protein
MLLAAKFSITVPPEQEDKMTVKEEPDEAEGVMTQPAAVPVLEKSDDVRPVTDSAKAKV